MEVVGVVASATNVMVAVGKVSVDKRGGFGYHPHGVDPNKADKIVNFVMSEKD